MSTALTVILFAKPKIFQNTQQTASRYLFFCDEHFIDFKQALCSYWLTIAKLQTACCFGKIWFVGVILK